MTEAKRFQEATRALRFVIAFAMSVYSVSNLMPLLVHIAIKGGNTAESLSVIAYLLVGFISICIVARTIYRLDRKAGRVQNKIGWFE
jgi:hypothetical protein